MDPFDDERLERCRRILRQEAAALDALAQRLDPTVCGAIDRLAECRGIVLLSGVGKSGLVAQKISATFAASGIRSFFLHPTEAQHGDLGRVGNDDLALLISYSGETEEMIRLAAQLSRKAADTIAITASARSRLGRAVNLTIELGTVAETCEWGLVPTTSATLTAAMGDALALGVRELRSFQRSQFGEIHPGGVLGTVVPNEPLPPIERDRRSGITVESHAVS